MVKIILYSMPKLKLSHNGFPKPLKVKCFQCHKSFEIKFVMARQQYSQKNNWDYWTEDSKYQNQRICNDCLRNIYQDKLTYWGAVKNSKKRTLFRVYLHSGWI